MVSGDGITADLKKLEAIKSYPEPANLKEVQQLLGLAGWYHKLIPNFAIITVLLNKLKKKRHALELDTGVSGWF